MTMGRPTLYKEEYCQGLRDYFSVEPYYIQTKEAVSKDGSTYDVEVKTPNDLPTLAGWCASIGISRECLHEWVRVYPDFSDAYKAAKELQENVLVTNGLQGLYNNTFAIFTAKNLINWRDKQELEHTGKDGGPIETKEVSKLELARRIAFLLTQKEINE